jgi:hypothetical protein
VAKIVDFTVVLANPTADQQARLEALKRVVNFVGDIHQPRRDHRARDGASARPAFQFQP